jgi:hypothetical protein
MKGTEEQSFKARGSEDAGCTSQRIKKKLYAHTRRRRNKGNWKHEGMMEGKRYDGYEVRTRRT